MIVLAHLEVVIIHEMRVMNALSKKKKNLEAIDCYSRSIALSPTSVAFANRAMAYIKLKSVCFKLVGTVIPVQFDAQNFLSIYPGIEPYMTIFHWDFPQSLEDQYGGFLSPLVVKDFRDYADLWFNTFGDRVKNWITLNEPWTYCHGGYAAGVFAPGRCSSWEARNCSAGDFGRDS